MIRLQHADAQEMRGLLQPFLDKTGLMMAYDSGNTLIVTDYASNIKRLVSKSSNSVDRARRRGPSFRSSISNSPRPRTWPRELEEVLQADSGAGPEQDPPGLDHRLQGRFRSERTNNLIILARVTPKRRMIRELVRKAGRALPPGVGPDSRPVS